jgi:hypothetical protein
VTITLFAVIDAMVSVTMSPVEETIWMEKGVEMGKVMPEPAVKKLSDVRTVDCQTPFCSTLRAETG